MPLILLDIPCPDRETALRLARTLVEERLIACGNVIDGVTSVYRWEGAIEESPEVILLAKTTAERADEAAKRAETLHPYSCACVGRIDLNSNIGYALWARKEIGPAESGPSMLRVIDFDGLGQPLIDGVSDGHICLLLQSGKVNIGRLKLLPPDKFGPQFDHPINEDELRKDAFRAANRAHPRLLVDVERDWVIECPQEIAINAKFDD
ncbi:MAG: divalent-cation tolerance protein CutA [Planctomycetota bacterium]